MRSRYRAWYVHFVRTAYLCSTWADVPSLEACGHNLIAVIAVVGAAALKAAMEASDMSGTVKVIGSPGTYFLSQIREMRNCQ